MIRQVQNSQESLFNTSVDELLKQYKITPAIVTMWYKSGYLSFDPLAYGDLNERQAIEFHFIGSKNYITRAVVMDKTIYLL